MSWNLLKLNSKLNFVSNFDPDSFHLSLNFDNFPSINQLNLSLLNLLQGLLIYSSHLVGNVGILRVLICHVFYRHEVYLKLTTNLRKERYPDFF